MSVQVHNNQLGPLAFCEANPIRSNSRREGPLAIWPWLYSTKH